MKLIAIVAMMSLAWFQPGWAGDSGTVRVYAIGPACFDYVFTTVMSVTTTNPVLSFNHRSGQTFFVHPGERLGDYVLANFTSAVTRVFNPAIKMHQEKKGGIAVLRCVNGQVIELPLGQRLPQPGWMAYLVDLADGNWWTVKSADTVVSGSRKLLVGPISSNSVTVLVSGSTNELPLISMTETTNLVAIWESRARSRNVAKADAEQEPVETVDDSWLVSTPVRVAEPAPRRKVTTTVIQYPSRTCFGEIYSCPVEYSVLPGIWSTTGQMIRPTIVVPRRFVPRTINATGISVETHYE